MSKVTKLPTHGVIANEQTIEKLREMLEMAEAGQLIELSAVYTTPDGAIMQQYTTTENLLVHLALADVLKATIQRRLFERPQ